LSNIYSSRAQKMRRSELAELFALAERPDVISFAGGFPDPDWFLPEIDEVAIQVMRDSRALALQYGPTPGMSTCREFVAERLAKKGVKGTGANTLITSGALQGVEIAAKMFLDPGDTCIVEAPTYIGTIATLEALEARLVSVPTDQDGMRTDLLPGIIDEQIRTGHRPKFIYTIPTFQNPSGCTLSLERRKKLVEIAMQYEIPIVEDDAYGELRYTGEPLPLIKSLDPAEIVIHLGTFSKIFSPGVRLGWFVASPEIIEKAIVFKQGTDQCSSSMAQLMAVEYGKRGLIEKQIDVTVASLKKKSGATLAALTEHFPPGSTWTIPQGGFYTWATVAGDVDTVELLPKAVRDLKVAYVAGPSFYADRSGKNKLRVCFSLVRPHEIPEGVRRLGELFKTAR
jgi:2-aminoadipate transaminase